MQARVLYKVDYKDERFSVYVKALSGGSMPSNKPHHVTAPEPGGTPEEAGLPDAPGWQCIRLSGAELARGKGNYLKNSFQSLYLSVGKPSSMALYMRFCDGKDAVFYLSPVATHHAQNLLRQYDAQPCAEVSYKQAVLVCGDLDSGQRDRAKPRGQRLGKRLQQWLRRMRVPRLAPG